MWQSESRREYERRLNLVINHIAANLGDPLALETLAAIACFSPYHFHRIFRGMMGETIGDFVWRLRLERAANQLRDQPSRSITRIALDCGYATPSSFARAFQARFGLSPGAYRRATRSPNGKAGTARPAPLRQDGLTRPRWAGTNEGAAMDIAVRELPARRVVYVRRLGYAKGVHQEHLNAAFQQVCSWVGERGLFGPGTLVIGVPHDNPDITPYDRCRYDACVTVPDTVTNAGDGVDVQELAGGPYAVLRLDVGDPVEIGQAVDVLYGDWLPSSGYETDDRPCLEIYHDSGAPGRIVLDYCVPIVPLSTGRPETVTSGARRPA